MFTKTSDRQNNETTPVQIIFQYPNRTDIGRKCIRYFLPEIVNTAYSCLAEKVTTHSFNGYLTYTITHDK